MMGAMAEKYGFYGAGSFEGTAESLLVGDTDEVFVFHVLPDDTGTSAIWVAQRVPDDHVTTVDNMFTIRGVNLTDTFNFYGSASIHDIAQKKGWWKPNDGLLDFTKIYSDGEYAHKYYSGRRMWGVYRRLAPSLNLSAEYGDLRFDNPYPWSVKPDKKVSAADLMAVHRDHYDGTKFDTTKGLAAGPFGNPDRFKGAANEKALNGSWERTITLFRTTYSFVNQARKDVDPSVGGVTYFGPHAAHGTCYVPLMAGGMTKLPKGYTIGMPRKIDRKASWWAHRYVQNLGHLRWKDMVDYIKAEQQKFEQKGFAMVQELTSSMPGKESITTDLTAHADSVISAWWQLADDLMMKYADGFFQEGDSYGEALGYDTWWLKAVGYENGPPPVLDHQKSVQYV
jgi:dipeptidase